MALINLAVSSTENHVVWMESFNIGFLQAKKALASATLLQHPKENAAIAVTVDALD